MYSTCKSEKGFVQQNLQERWLQNLQERRFLLTKPETMQLLIAFVFNVDEITIGKYKRN